MTRRDPLHGPFELGDWEVRPKESLLVQGEEKVRLEPRVMEVLLCLARQAGDVVSRETLTKEVWGGEHAIEDGALPQAVHLIRRALGDNARKPEFIQTVPKRGYRLIAEVQPIDELKGSAAGGSRSGPVVLALLAILVVALSVGYLLGLRGGSRALTPITIEILPFSTDSQNRAFIVGGLEHTLRGQLSRHPLIRTVKIDEAEASRSPEALSARAKEHGLDAIVVGRSWPAGSPDRVDVEVHLPGKRTRTFTLSMKLDRLAEEMEAGLETVCDALGLPAHHAPALQLGTDQEVLELFFRGLAGLEPEASAETAQIAITALQKAVEIDPEHVLSLSALAHLHLASAHKEDRARAYAEAYMAAQQAVSIDPGVAEAHLALMRIMIEYEWDWAAAERHYRRTVKINPSHWRAYYQHAWFKTIWQNFDQALAELERAQALQPDNTFLRVARVKILYLAGRFDEAVALGRELLDLDPQPPDIQRALGRALLARGDTREAVEILRQGVELSNGMPLPLSALAHALAVTGETSEARAILAELEKVLVARQDRLALVHVGLGEFDQALECLEHARNLRAPGIVQVGVDPRFRPLARDSRFHDILAKVGLPPTGAEAP